MVPTADQPLYYVSLGAGKNQLPLIQAARRLGLSIIAVDQNLKAPGFDLADIQLQCSLLRPRRILQSLQENVMRGMIAGVGCRSFGRANVSAALVSQELGLPGLDPYRALAFRNKRKLKEFFARNTVNVPKSYAYGNESERRRLASAPLPLIARPSAGHAKQGITMLRTQDDTTHFLTRNPSDNGRWLIEEVIEGDEITVLGLVSRGTYRTIIVTDKITSKEPPLFAEVMHRFPSSAAAGLEPRIQEVMQTIVDAAAITGGPIVAEFIVSGKGIRKNLSLVEASPDAGGEYIADELVSAALGTSFFEDMVRLSSLYLQEYAAPEPVKTPEIKAVIIRFILQKEGRLKTVKFPDALFKHPGHLFSHQLRFPGDVTSVNTGNTDRVAVFALSGAAGDVHALESDANALASEMIVEYEGGNK
ncbi:MAG: ATP-grasp domain-containing protein [Spirochaetia bacterium]|nr:ATP-grasp domain-containing protein [Spirochaetia bacterium]